MQRLILATLFFAACSQPKVGDLGPCEIDSDEWDSVHPTYNFDDSRLYFGCQTDPTETWYVGGFDSIILSDETALDSASVAASAFTAALSTWSFHAEAEVQAPQLEDGLSRMTAAEGHPGVVGWIASKWIVVTLNDTEVECENTFYTEKLLPGGTSTESLTWAVDSSSNALDLTSAMFHELGHCAGLGHPNSPANWPGSIMHDNLSNGEIVHSLADIDTDALQFLYELVPPVSNTTTTP